MKKLIFLIFSILFISLVSANLPIYPKPLSSGNIQPNQAFNYSFSFSLDSVCNTPLLTNTSDVVTGTDGIGFLNIPISSLNSVPLYFCETRNGTQRLNTSFGDQIFDKIYVNNSLFNNVNSTGNISTNSYFVGDGRFLTNLNFGAETDPKAYNGTLAYNSSLADYYPLNNPYGYLNTSSDSFAGNYSDFLTLFTNGYGFYNQTNFNISDYYLNTNPFGFYNSTNPSPEPLWSANYTDFNDTWSSTYNSTYNTWAYNQTTPAINQILDWGYINSSTETNWNANYTDFLTLFTNGFGFYNSSDFSISDYYLNSNPNGYYNQTDFNISDYATGTQLLNNISDANTSIKTYLDAQDILYNNSIASYVDSLNFYVDNSHNYTNATLLSNFTDDLGNRGYTSVSNFSNNLGYYNSTDFDINNYLLQSNRTLNGNYSATDFCLTDGSKCISGVITSESDPKAYNGSLYLSNNPYGFYNSSDFNINDYYLNSNPYIYWNSTFAEFNKTYADTLYISATNDSFYLDNSHSYWNDTYATFNKTYADTLYQAFGNVTNTSYYLASNPSNFIDLATYFTNATQEFYPLNNPYSYINSSTETNWNANYSQVLNLLNNGYGFYNQTNFNISDYYPLNNPYGYINTSLADTQKNATGYLYNDTTTIYLNDTKANSTWYPIQENDFQIWNAIDNGTFLKTYTETDPKAYNGTLAYNGSLSGYVEINSENLTSVYCGNITQSASDLCTITDTNTQLNLINGSNITISQSGLDRTINVNMTGLEQFSDTLYQPINNVVNTSYYVDNVHNYSNFTKLSQFENDLSFYLDNVHNYTNATVLSNFTNDVGFITIDAYFDNATQTFYIDNSHSYVNTTNFPNLLNVYLNTTNQFGYINLTTLSGNETDPKWSGNLSNYSSVYNFVTNGTFRLKSNNTIYGDTFFMGKVSINNQTKSADTFILVNPQVMNYTGVAIAKGFDFNPVVNSNSNLATATTAVHGRGNYNFTTTPIFSNSFQLFLAQPVLNETEDDVVLTVWTLFDQARTVSKAGVQGKVTSGWMRGVDVNHGIEQYGTGFINISQMVGYRYQPLLSTDTSGGVARALDVTGLEINDISKSGAGTEKADVFYGIHIKDLSGGDTNYGIVEDGPELNGIGGKPIDQLFVNGDINITGCLKDDNGTIYAGACLSSEKFKTDIINITTNSTTTDKLKSLNVINFKYNDNRIYAGTRYYLVNRSIIGDWTKVYGGYYESTTNQTFWSENRSKDIYYNLGDRNYEGFSAEQVEGIYPDWINLDEFGNKRVIYGLPQIIELWKQNKEQQKEIDLLKSELCLKDNTYSWCK